MGSVTAPADAFKVGAPGDGGVGSRKRPRDPGSRRQQYAPPPPPVHFLSVYFCSVSFCPCLPGPLGLDKLPPTPPPLSPDRMSVRDTQARLATPGDAVIVPADAGQLACLAAIDDADYIIQDEVVLKSGVPEAASLSYDLFKDCDSSEKLAAVLYGSRTNVVLVGEMTEYDKIQHAIKRLLADLPMLGRFVVIMLEPVGDDNDRPSFLNRALALNSNLPFGCDKLQMADRSLMHIRTHGRFDVWIASSTRDSRSLSPPPTYKLLRLMTPGAEVDEVVFHEPDVRDNQYAVQVHNDLINGLLGSIGLNSDEVHLLPGTDPRNSKLFFTESNEE